VPAWYISFSSGEKRQGESSRRLRVGGLDCHQEVTNEYFSVEFSLLTKVGELVWVSVGGFVKGVEGYTDGSFDGWLVDDESDGESEGACDNGWLVDGDSDGECDGKSDGKSDGNSKGWLLGCTEGKLDGVATQTNAPNPFEMQVRDLQSLSTKHVWSMGQAGQSGPPQSMPVSLRSFIPSIQVALEGAIEGDEDGYSEGCLEGANDGIIDGGFVCSITSTTVKPPKEEDVELVKFEETDMNPASMLSSAKILVEFAVRATICSNLIS